MPELVRVLPLPPDPTPPEPPPRLGVQQPLLLHHPVDPHVVGLDAVVPPEHGDEMAGPHLEPGVRVPDSGPLLGCNTDPRAPGFAGGWYPSFAPVPGIDVLDPPLRYAERPSDIAIPDPALPGSDQPLDLSFSKPSNAVSSVYAPPKSPEPTCLQ